MNCKREARGVDSGPPSSVHASSHKPYTILCDRYSYTQIKRSALAKRKISLVLRENVACTRQPQNADSRPPTANGNPKATQSSPAEKGRPPFPLSSAARAASALSWLYYSHQHHRDSQRVRMKKWWSDERRGSRRRTRRRLRRRSGSGAAVTELREDTGTGTGTRGAARWNESPENRTERILEKEKREASCCATTRQRGLTSLVTTLVTSGYTLVCTTRICTGRWNLAAPILSGSASSGLQNQNDRVDLNLQSSSIAQSTRKNSAIEAWEGTRIYLYLGKGE